jgi:hypothetical protein
VNNPRREDDSIAAERQLRERLHTVAKRAPESVQFSLKLRDPLELHFLVVPNVVENPAALVQQIDDAVELGACHVHALGFRNSARLTDVLPGRPRRAGMS